MLMELRWLNKTRRLFLSVLSPPPPPPTLPFSSEIHRLGQRGWKRRRAMRRNLKGKFPAVAPVTLCLWLRWGDGGGAGELPGHWQPGSQQAGMQAGRSASSSHEARSLCSQPVRQPLFSHYTLLLGRSTPQHFCGVCACVCGGVAALAHS